ncbi:MAG TPA: histidine phosphatase family protein [Kineosporiaceae bacterium]|nr:histidine phosphatase family protein [Kineosporiaceae bacterium]
MATVLLVRHGRTSANAGGILAGWTPGVGLDESGVAQAAALAGRMAVVPLAAVVSSPLQRCRETADALIAVPGPKGVPRPAVEVDDRLGECRYGSWTGRPIKELVKDPLWRVVQAHPSAVTFPGEAGESMLTMQHRAVEAVREHDARVTAAHGADAVWVAVSHGDVIKAVLADALGMHLDSFQRLIVDPCSVSVIRYTSLRPFAVRINDTGGELTGLVPARPVRRSARPRPAATGHRSRGGLDPSDAVIGGGDTPSAQLSRPDAGPVANGGPARAGDVRVRRATATATP